MFRLIVLFLLIRNDIYQTILDVSMMWTISDIDCEDSLAILVNIGMLGQTRAYSTKYQSHDSLPVHADQSSARVWPSPVWFSYTMFEQNQGKRVAHPLDSDPVRVVVVDDDAWAMVNDVVSNNVDKRNMQFVNHRYPQSEIDDNGREKSSSMTDVFVECSNTIDMQIIETILSILINETLSVSIETTSRSFSPPVV